LIIKKLQISHLAYLLDVFTIGIVTAKADCKFCFIINKIFNIIHVVIFTALQIEIKKIKKGLHNTAQAFSFNSEI